MLIVHSALGSPGASTTALYLAAQWASTGTEVLLVEADPGGGSLGHHLGIHFTPGSASFVASGLPVGGGNLIDHSQDVLLSNLHVMPSTSSPSGAREITRWLDERAEALRDVSASEVALIIDAGRMSGGALGANLRSRATGVVVVARGDASPASLERIGGLLSTEVRGDEADRCVVTIGDSPLSAEEWREKCGVRFCGSVRLFAEVKGDLSAFLNRNKRKAKPWRLSLEEVARDLLPYTKAPAAGAAASQRLERGTDAAPIAPAEVTVTEPAGDAAGDGGARQPVPAAAAPGEAAPLYPEAVHAVPAEVWTGAASPAAQLPPPFNVPEPGYWQSPPESQPTSMAPPSIEPPPLPEDPFAEAPPIPSYAPQPAASPPSSEPPIPSYAPPPAPPPPQQPPPSHPPQQPPPSHPPQQPPPDSPEPFPPHWAPEEPAAAPQGPSAYPSPAHYPPPPPGYELAHEPPPMPAAPQPPGYEAAHEPPPMPAAPQPPADEAAHEPPPGAEPEPDVGPSGSFRDWASRLHGPAPQSNAGGDA